MIIKSEFFKEFNFGKLFSNIGVNLYSKILVVIGAFLTAYAMYVTGMIFIKLLVILIWFIAPLIVYEDLKPIDRRQAWLVSYAHLFFFIILLEIFNFLTTLRTEKIDLITIYTERNSTIENKQEKQYVYQFYNVADNEFLGESVYTDANKNEAVLVNNIKSKEIYIAYLPFVKYSEETRYIRK